MSNKRVQFKGPFNEGYVLPLEQRSFKLGISIGEKDFMKFGNSSIDGNDRTTKGFGILLGETPILIGRTFMYETVEPIYDSISFPMGAPASLIVDILYNG